MTVCKPEFLSSPFLSHPNDRWCVGDAGKDVPLGQVDIGLLADQVGVTTADTLDTGQGVHNLLLAIDVGVKQTQNELEVRLLAGHERCRSHTITGQPFSVFFAVQYHTTWRSISSFPDAHPDLRDAINEKQRGISRAARTDGNIHMMGDSGRYRSVR